MPLQWWISLILAVCAITFSPGNGAMLSMRYGLKGGLGYASAAILGLQLGLLGVYILVLCSLMLTTRLSPHVLDILALIGGSYLIYLGGKDLWNAWKHPEHSSKFAHLADPSRREPIRRRIAIGAFTNLTNPKGILFMVAFFPQWLKADAPWSFTEQAIAMGCVAVLIDTIVMHGYAGLAGTIRHLLVRPALFRSVEAFLGGILFLMGIVMIGVRF